MATPMNKAIFDLVAFLKRRWKLLTFGISCIFFVRWARNQGATTVLIDTTIKSFEPHPVVNPSLQRGFIFHPECMNHWINDHLVKEKMTHYFRHKFNAFEKTFIKPVALTHSKTSASNQCNQDLENLPRVIVSEAREKYFDHFAHFAEYYLRLYSMILWQRNVYSLYSRNETCIYQFQISSKNIRFWEEAKRDSNWMKQLLLAVNTASQYNTITSDLANHGFYSSKSSFPTILLRGGEGYFLHPSDATLLTSLVLGRDPCQLAGKVEQIVTKPINILIINRKDYRALHNLDNVTSFFEEFKREPLNFHQPIPRSLLQHSHYNHSGHSQHYRAHTEVGKVSTTYFEGKSLIQQAAEVHEADVILSVHGAQLTNFIFLKPCSIVIEIMPWLYNISSDFRRYSSSADVLYYSWGANRVESFFIKPNPRDPFQENPCSFYLLRYKRISNIESLSSVDLTNMCFEDSNGECRTCARHVTEIQINLEKLKYYFLLALKDRRRCIQEHPFYSKH